MFRLNSYNTMAYLLDVNDPTKLYTKTLDLNGQSILESFTMSKDKIASDETNFVTLQMLDEILDDKLDKLFKKYNRPSRNRNNKNQNREVE